MGKTSKTKSGACTPAKKSKIIKKTGKTINISKAKSSVFTKEVTLYRNQKDCFLADEKMKGYGFATRAIHAGNQKDQLHGGVSVPIDLSSTYGQT